MLLKNNGLLPLEAGALTRVAAVGPNAKVAQIMGGGSAQVNAHYRVSPFEGLRTQLPEVELGFELGCTNHKLLPLLGSSPEGALDGDLRAEYFNSPDISGTVVHRAAVPEAQLIWLDAVGHGIGMQNFSARFSGTLQVFESGVTTFDLISAWRSRLFIDSAPIIDNWDDWRPGDAYFGSGSAPRLGEVQLVAGTHDLRLEFGSYATGELGISAWRLGMFRPLPEDALERAGALAVAADVAIVCVGLNGEWETESNDRADL